MSFEIARGVADAVLLEGYVLYPYRSSAVKNRYRWTFGVIAPESWSKESGADPSRLGTQMLLEASHPEIEGRLRFLQVRERRIETLVDDRVVAVDTLTVDGVHHVAWQEGELRELDFETSPFRDGDTSAFDYRMPGSESREPLIDASGAVVGALVHVTEPLEVRVRVTWERLATSALSWRLSLSVENRTPAKALATRPDAMRRSLASSHVLLSIRNGAFVSSVDPPAPLADAARACRCEGLYPVLAGSSDVVLCSPIILEEHPELSPESPGNFFDATEIDEMLVLRTLTLTPDEKDWARVTDARSSELIERVESMSDEARLRLHGVVHGEPSYGVGERVRLCPGRRRTDAQDALFSGRTATIARIEHDVDGSVMLAVTIDDDPAAELYQWQGRYQYYRLDEIEPIRGGTP